MKNSFDKWQNIFYTDNTTYFWTIDYIGLNHAALWALKIYDKEDDFEMNSDFPRILTLLRKEKGISQKKASQELGISQALLSHYEKGIRECGLSFVTRAADFYGVSCDYLLGRSPEREGTTLSADDLSDPQDREEKTNPRNLKTVYNKKLLFCSLNILFDLLANAESKELTDEVCSFLFLAVYRMFRVGFRVNPSNNDEMFMIPDALANVRAQAKMTECEGNANVIASGELPKWLPPPKNARAVAVTSETLERDYPQDKSALLNLIKQCETKLWDQNK